jgi:hypothetical protein
MLTYLDEQALATWMAQDPVIREYRAFFRPVGLVPRYPSVSAAPGQVPHPIRAKRM